MPEVVETSIVRSIACRCPATEEIVELRVKGSVFYNLINGNVVGCSRTKCQAKNTPYCLLQKHIQTTAR